MCHINDDDNNDDDDDDDDDDVTFVDDADAIYVKLHDTIMRNDVRKCKYLIETMEIDLNKLFKIHKKVRIMHFLVFLYQSRKVENSRVFIGSIK